jgi:hypothetical protein
MLLTTSCAAVDLGRLARGRGFACASLVRSNCESERRCGFVFVLDMGAPA